jgi:hypothetical protein
MAGVLRTMDTDILQVRKVYARTPTNGFIPSSYILISGGDGSTQWNSVSSILEVSSFKTVKGNSATTFSADLYNRTLQISTTGIQGVLESYVDSQTNALMLSNYLPPFVVGRGSVPLVTVGAATIVPNPESLQQVTGQSTIKFLGVNDIQLSTVTTQRAVFFSISSYTSVGYSTISGETFAWRPTLYSTLSNAYTQASFISSVPFTVGTQGWNWGSNIPFSTPAGTQDIYFSSIIFQLDHVAPYIDFSRNSSTRLYVDYNPTLLFSTMFAGNTSLVKEISTFIQYENPSLTRRVLPETNVTNYITSQRSLADATPFLSNSFDTPIRFNFDIYKSFYSTYTANNFNTVNFAIYHRIVNGATDGFTSGFSSLSSFSNFTPKSAGLFLNLVNQSPTLS